MLFNFKLFEYLYNWNCYVEASELNYVKYATHLLCCPYSQSQSQYLRVEVDGLTLHYLLTFVSPSIRSDRCS